LNNWSSIRPIFTNLGSKCSNISILIYTTHKHIATLSFKMCPHIPKDHFQSYTEVLHGWSHHSIWHFLECRDYVEYEVTNIFAILNIHFAFDVSPQNIVHWCHVRICRWSGDVAVLWTCSSNPSSWEIFVQPVTHICRPVWSCSILDEDVFIWILELTKFPYESSL